MITFYVDKTELNFEHSLVSLSNWEAEYERPWYSNKKEDRTDEEIRRYFELMYIGPKKHRHLVQLLTHDEQLALIQYISKPRTATTVREIQNRRGGSRENVTSELIYYWLVAFKIPFSPTETWHLNRLLMLVKVCSAKQAPAQKSRQSKAQLAQSMREINERRRNELGTTG